MKLNSRNLAQHPQNPKFHHWQLQQEKQKMKMALWHVAQLMSGIRKGKNAVLYAVKKIHLIGKHPSGRRWAMLLSLSSVLIDQECILIGYFHS